MRVNLRNSRPPYSVLLYFLPRVLPSNPRRRTHRAASPCYISSQSFSFILSVSLCFRHVSLKPPKSGFLESAAGSMCASRLPFPAATAAAPALAPRHVGAGALECKAGSCTPLSARSTHGSHVTQKERAFLGPRAPPGVGSPLEPRWAATVPAHSSPSAPPGPVLTLSPLLELPARAAHRPTPARPSGLYSSTTLPEYFHFPQGLASFSIFFPGFIVTIFLQNTTI